MEDPANYQFRTQDAAKRMHDTIRLHQTVLSRGEILAGRFVAIRLADGGSDGVAYTSRAEAIEHQRHNMSRCGYFQIPLERWSEKTCDVLLWYVRAAYDAGHREDPASQLFIPSRLDDLR